jgi:hypothetical protein
MATKPIEIVRDAEAEVPVKAFTEMSEAEYAEWDRSFFEALEAGDNGASQASLAAGVLIYYAEDETPSDCVIKKYADGRRELITLFNGNEKLLRIL